MKSKLYFGLICLTLYFSLCIKMNAQSQRSPSWAWVKSVSSTKGIYGKALTLEPIRDRAGSGNIYVAGGFDGKVDFDPGPETLNLSSESGLGVFISKVDGSGNFLWTKTMVGIAGDAYASAIAIDPADLAIYTTGRFQGTVDFDPGEGIHNITAYPTYTTNFPFCGANFITKLDDSGNFVWATVFGGTEDVFVSSLALDPLSGDVYTTGNFGGTVDFDPGPETFNLTSVGDYDMFITKLNSSGDFLWTKAIGGPGYDFSYSIALDPAGSGSVYTTGFFSKTVDFDPGIHEFNLTAPVGQYIFISKLDDTGEFKWAKRMGRAGIIDASRVGAITLDPFGSGDVYTTGTFQGTADFNPGEETCYLTTTGSSDVFISKFSDSGDFRMAKAMGGRNSQDIGIAVAIQPGGSGNIYTIGNFNGVADFDPGADAYNLSAVGKKDIFISSLDSSGNFIWAKSIKGGNDDIITAIDIDNQFLYLTGYFISPSISFDSLTIPNISTAGTVANLFITKLDLLSVSVATIDSKSQQINIYPNPAANELTIEFDEEEKYDADITLFNILGEVVFSRPVECIGHKKTIDISALATGIYFIDIDLDGEEIIRRVVKE